MKIDFKFESGRLAHIIVVCTTIIVTVALILKAL
jgi:hypothetical protein